MIPRHPGPIASLIVLSALLSACNSSDDDEHETHGARIELLGNRADLVSDGDALARITLDAQAQGRGLKVTLNGADVTPAFARQSDGSHLGLLQNLAVGRNTVEVSAEDTRTERLEITNHPRGGPILSGEPRQPFFCATVNPAPASDSTPATDASGLGTEAYDPACNIATEYKLYYRTTAQDCSLAVPDPSPPAAPPANACFKPYDPQAARPADLATTTTDAGLSVPYIVRVERGTMNRGIYDIAVLIDPAKPWDSALEAQPAWNGKVNFLFGGGGGQPHKQMRPASAWTDELSLSRGWLVAVNSMTDSTRNNNRVVSAETTMMMKEHIVDRYGAIRFTVATGCSAGSINAYSVSSLQPGLIDGAIVSCALLDYDTSHMENYECGLLVQAYDSDRWRDLMRGAGYSQDLINAKKAAINGHKDSYACQTWFNSFFGPQRWNGSSTVSYSVPAENRETGRIVATPLATPRNNCMLPASLVWDPDTNPNGVRCSPWDWMSSILGTDAAGIGRTPRDNSGVQYGLAALRAGVVTPEEFVQINEIVGGISPEGYLTPERAVGDPDALDIVYRNGLIVGPGLDSLAVIDLRGADDLHPHWRSFAMRARLNQENGHHGNHVMWRWGMGTSSPPLSLRVAALEEMDKWLSRLTQDTSDQPLPRKVVAARPDTAFDYCLLSGDASQSVKVTDPAACDADLLLRPHASPRQAAGGPRAEDVIKCQLKPLDPADYAPAILDASQLQRLRTVFADGVCDWTRPGVGKQPRTGVPLTYAGGPGGQPLPPAPASTPEP